VNLPLRPPWEFRDEKDRLQFKAWMNQQLDELCEPTFDDICLEEQRMSDPASPQSRSIIRDGFSAGASSLRQNSEMCMRLID
jgi:hypothetical protein